jgi:hypothetical protein
VELPTLWRQSDPGHPVAYPSDVDMAGLDEAGNACASAAHERALEAVAWLVEEAVEGRVRARYGEPKRVLCLLWCANPQQKEESQTRRVRE